MSKLAPAEPITPQAPPTRAPDGRPRWVGTLARYGVLAVGAAIVLIPVGWIILSSFKSQGELFQRPPTFLPESFGLQNYTEALSQFAFLKYLRNTLIVTIGATVLTLVINSMAAFALAKYNFRGRDFLFLVTLGTIMVPLQIILIPVFLVMAQLGLVNSLWGLIIPPAATPTGVFLLRQYMLTLPDELLEAARLDGAGEWQVFWRIVIPLAWPALAVVTTFSRSGAGTTTCGRSSSSRATRC